MNPFGRPQQSEVEFLRALVVQQQEQIRELEGKIHALADPIAAARLAMAARLTERRPPEPDNGEERKKGGKSFRASEIDRKHPDRVGGHQDIRPNYRDPRRPETFFDGVEDDGQPSEGVTAEPRSQ